MQSMVLLQKGQDLPVICLRCQRFLSLKKVSSILRQQKVVRKGEVKSKSNDVTLAFSKKKSLEGQ